MDRCFESMILQNSRQKSNKLIFNTWLAIEGILLQKYYFQLHTHAKNNIFYC